MPRATDMTDLLQRFLVAIGVIAAISVGPIRQAKAQNYKVVTLDTLGNNHYPQFISGTGAICGYFVPDADKTVTHTFLYSNGTVSDIHPPDVSDTCNGINNSDQVLMTIYLDKPVSGSNPRSHVVVYQSGRITELATVPMSRGTFISNSGDVIGEVINNQRHVGFVALDAPPLPPPTVPVDQFICLQGTLDQSPIYRGLSNIHKLVVGSLGDGHAVVFDGNRMRIKEIGTLGGTFSYATSINDKDEVLGTSRLAGKFTTSSHVFLYKYASDSITDMTPDFANIPITNFIPATRLTNNSSFCFMCGNPLVHYICWRSGSCALIDTHSSSVMPDGYNVEDLNIIDMNDNDDMLCEGRLTTPGGGPAKNQFFVLKRVTSSTAGSH